MSFGSVFYCGSYSLRPRTQYSVAELGAPRRCRHHQAIPNIMWVCDRGQALLLAQEPLVLFDHVPELLE
jgi:hypothetical protein